MSEAPAGRPRLLLVTRNLPPLRGGMERLNLHIALELAQWTDLVVVGPEGSRSYLPPHVDVVEVPVRPLWRFLLRSAVEAWRHAKGADAVLAGSGLTGPAAVLAARRSSGKAIAYLHGLDLVTPHPLYRALWLPALHRLDAVLTNSCNTATLAREARAARGNVAILHPGTDIPETIESDVAAFRQRFDLGDGPLLLSVGRLTERKGLAEFVERALPAIVSDHTGVRLVVIGDDAPDALRGHGKDDPGSRLKDAVQATQLERCVRRLGPCDDATLNDAYAAASVHVFPVRHVPGDVEGFGMVAIEAAARSLPTVAFDVGGVGDAVADGCSGYLIDAGDYSMFARRVSDVITQESQGTLRGAARQFAADFSWDRFGTRLRGLLEHVLTQGRPPGGAR